MTSYFKGAPIFGARGPSGPDGTPIGTIISFMGTKAPQDYVICDGAEYNITDYYDLCQFINEQFGSVNYFGGDGVTTFAVPDLRNLFLRGYHGEAVEQLSGDIGVKQEGTEAPYFEINALSEVMVSNNSSGMIQPSNTDSISGFANACRYTKFGSTSTHGVSRTFAPRPVNTAVLYCIKVAPSFPVLDEYDTDDGWHVRKWSDGYIEMSSIFQVTIPNGNSNLLVESKKYPIELADVYGISQYAFGSGWYVIVTDSDLAGGSGTTDLSYFMKQSPAISLRTHTGSAVTRNVSSFVSLSVTGRWK